MVVYVLKSLINNMSIIILVAYFISRIKMFKNLVTGKKGRVIDKLIMSVIFGCIGILATYTGVSVNGAIANSRIIGVLVGGIFGGPLVGLGAGVIAGIHRWSIDIGGFTAVACALSTIIEGVIGGVSSKYIKNLKYNWIHAFIIGLFAEVLQMAIILVIARPFDAAVELVKIIWIPMVLFNPVGISLFVGIIDGIYKEQDREAAIQTQLALDIAEKCLVYMRKGLSDIKNMREAAAIMLKMSGAAAVAITDSKNILAHVGTAEDHHKENLPFQTQLTRQVLNTGELSVAQNKEEIGCSHADCMLKSAVIVPLVKKEEIIGTIKIYKTREYGISDIDIRLAEGLAKLFSTQLELADMDYQVKLRQKAELRVLQSQINPHFLFNSLNTIISFCRVKPEKARELLINLSTYFRNTLKHSQDFISLEEELNHVNAYLSLEKARFEDKLTVETYLDGDLNCTLPQFILQPIIENAVKHGVLPTDCGGNVVITARSVNDETVITVDDNGEGIDERIVNQLYNDSLPDSKIGLANAHRRLKSIYGDAYGLKIWRREGGGTSVQIRIPHMTEGDIANA